MPNSVNGNENGTPRSSLLSPVSATLSPTWRPPKSPLAPHRLAKLANALGVSTPVPANQASPSYLSRSYSDSSSTLDHPRRSPTPSSTVGSSMGFSSYSSAPQTSKFLLHVVPPLYLPHDSNSPDDLKTPPPPNAPGYHTQFRRGTLVPVHSTLQAQLGAIAKEYALPSSAGLILYLVTAIPQSPLLQAPMDEPGPRLSEDIWKHLWTRVLRTEQQDDGLMPSRSPTPHTPSPFMLRLGPAARSTPFLAQEQTANLRPLISSPAEPMPSPHAPQPTYPTTPAPSTPSSASDRQSNNKSAPPSSTSVSQSEPGTPDTSVEDSGLRANFLDLPGLNSPSLIPILAKVEFDIDRRKAAWYEPWVRSRKANHAKRTESRKGSRSEEADGEQVGSIWAIFRRLCCQDRVEEQEQEQEQEQEEGGYARLSESPDEINSDSDSDGDDFGEDATARVSASLAEGKDALGDVFGSDADTWADIHATNGVQPNRVNPNVVNLALTAEELAALPSPKDLEDDSDTKSTKEEDEVIEMLEMMGKPDLAVAIPSPEKNLNKRSSSPANGARKIPPPLVLKPKDKSGTTIVAASNGRHTSDDSTGLAYLGGASDHNGSEHEDDTDEFNEYKTRVRSPAESDKRGGAVFDDLDLGLEPTEDFDDDDPNDRRRSQYLMRAQLDEIERTMASLSPRFMTTDLGEEQNLSFNSATLSPSTPANLTLSPGRSFDFLPPPSPRLPQHPDPPENGMFFAGESWPAVPFSTIKDREGLPSAGNANAPPSPPRLALNGSVATGPSESERRKKELEDEEALYPPSIASRNSQEGLAESPIIPLSPDPFGRHPSTPEPPSFQKPGAQSWDTMTIGKGGQSLDPKPAPAPQYKAEGALQLPRVVSLPIH
ncbi:hypothetical protein BDZ97DRAFT_1919391 [Flammula alnicola]|nr:hypothetical protein BDZ97DRAFT_1919391 [Flammula alnicola]